MWSSVTAPRGEKGVRASASTLCDTPVGQNPVGQSQIMGKPNVRFVAKAVERTGWRVWDRTQKKWWGNSFRQHPDELLAELNGSKRPEKLVELCKQK